MNVSSWLKAAAKEIDRLDAELILAHAMGVERVYLHAHSERELTLAELSCASDGLLRRQKHEPVAYIIGSKEFYGHTFQVSPAVLIPRPETETLVSLVKSYLTSSHLLPEDISIVDVGTGSGCIAISLALELPAITNIFATDISAKALECAKYNAAQLGASNIRLIKSDLLSSHAIKHQTFDVIVANLPYVDHTWPWLSPELKYEPKLSLYAKDHGLYLIKRLICQAPKHLKPAGALIIEANISQHQDIIDYAVNEVGLILDDREYLKSDAQDKNQVLSLALRFGPQQIATESD